MDDIIKKIQKLFALGSNKNPNENERMQALQMAEDLLVKHNLDKAEIDGFNPEKPHQQFCEDFRLEKWIRTVLSAVCKLYFTSYYMSGDHPVFIGTKENIAVTCDVAKWLIESIRKESLTAFKNVKLRNSFRMGAARSLYEKACQIVNQQKNASQATTGTSLMVLRNALEKANEDYMSTLNLIKSRSRSSRVDGFAYDQGKSYGSSLNLNKQISNTRGLISG